MADALNIDLVTVNQILANYEKVPTSLYTLILPKDRPEFVIDSSYQEAVRTFIRASNLQGIDVIILN